MACYFITNGGRQKFSDHHKVLFPCFENLSNEVAPDKVHKAMKSYIGHIPGVSSEQTLYGIRVYEAYHMA